MAYSTNGGTVGSVSSDPLINTLITPDELQQVYSALNTSSAVVDVTLGAQSLDVSSPATVVLVDDTEADKEGLLAAQPDAFGGLSNVGQYATYVTNNTANPAYIVGTSSASFVEYQGSGSATVDGGTSQKFVADTSHSTANNTLDASRATGSYSFLIGGSGQDTINGSTNANASSVIVAGSGQTTVNAGAGAATVYGGGATTVLGGTHAGQAFVDFTGNSHDSLQAGSGGHNIIGVASGMNVLDDTNGDGTDTLFSGAGQDTLLGSTAGTTFGIGNGVFDLVSKGGDTVYVAGSNSGTDTISGPTTQGVFDTIHFLSSTQSAAELNAMLQASATQSSDGSATITFSTSGDSPTQTLHVNNAVHVVFK